MAVNPCKTASANTDRDIGLLSFHNKGRWNAILPHPALNGAKKSRIGKLFQALKNLFCLIVLKYLWIGKLDAPDDAFRSKNHGPKLFILFRKVHAVKLHLNAWLADTYEMLL